MLASTRGRLGMSALQDGQHGRGIPVGMDQDDLALGVEFEHVDAFEVDRLAILADALAGPFDGGGVAGEEDALFGEADGIDQAEDAGEEAAEGFVAMVRRGTDRVVAGGVRCKGTDEALDVHASNGGEVLGYSLLVGDRHGVILLRAGRLASDLIMGVADLR